jgi:nucleotide-binding universal stress UspA family protein
MRTIIAAVDDSIAASPVLATALSIAPLFDDATVKALHVAEDSTERSTARATAEAHGVPLVGMTGNAVDELLRAAQARDVVAVVVGSRNRSRGCLGHLPLALAGRLDIPVVVVPPETPPPEEVRRVLIAMEGSREKARHLARPVELAAGPRFILDVIRVFDESTVPSFSDQVQYEAEDYSREFLSRFVPAAPDAHLLLRVGSPADEILAAADEHESDLIAAGWPHTDDPSRGEVAREIVARSRRPVLLVATT